VNPHLHLIREVVPDPKPEYQIHPMWCPSCSGLVFVIHLGLPPEDPKSTLDKDGDIQCPEDGRWFVSKAAYATHRGRMHKEVTR
jgi:hypothetical protein